MNTILEHALQYSKLGWHVFPCAPGQKTPLTAHGVKDATATTEQILKWWVRYPKANVAVACGQISGIHVCDIDHGVRVSGWRSIEEAAKNGNFLTETVMQRTPSGGAHLFYVTDNSPANKNSFLPGIDIRSDGYYVVLAPSIHPNGGVYAWAEGLSPWDRQAAVWPDFLRPLPKPVSEPEAAVRASQEVMSDPGDVICRASAYLATCDPAIQGMGGHDKLLWAAVAMVHGFMLTDSQAFDLLAREYNPRCEPPWDLGQQSDARDFSRKISEARKLVPSKPSGWLLLDDSYAPLDTSRNMSDEARRALIAASMAPQQEPMPVKQPKIRRLMKGKMHLSKEWQFLTKPTGLLGNICSWMNQTSRLAQPLISLGCALAFCGALFGRKIKTDCGLRTNVYCMGVGRSSAGKNHARVLIRKIAEKACCTELIGGEDFASDAAIEKSLSDHPSLVFLLDEVGHLMSYARRGGNAHLHKIVPLLMKLYTYAGETITGRAYAENDKQRVLVQPCCCIWGTTTPDEFTAGLTTRDINSGWLSRCLVFRTDSIPDMRWDITEAVPPEEIAAAVAWWDMLNPNEKKVSDVDDLLNQRGGKNTDVGPSPRIVPIEHNADMRFRKLYYDSIDRAETAELGYGGLWLKSIENAKKIALIVAASEDFVNSVITEAIADYACRLVWFLVDDFCRNTAGDIFDNPMDQKKRRIIAIVREAGVDGILKRGITHKTQKMFNGRERDSYLQDLMEAGELYREISGQKVIFRTEEYQRQHLAKQGRIA